jgi:ABC-type multidrug transport system ATPase subunit
MLRVSALTKRYGRFTALDEVSFHVREGEVLGLIGPNGSGKTTLFECLGGLLPFEGGEITQATPHSIFYVPDAVAPWPAQPVVWVLRYMTGLFGGPAESPDRVIRSFDLAAILHVPMGQLSKGQRKRVLLAVGMLMPQPLLLADEPFEGLDLRQTREVARVLREVAANGRTLFLSIHQIADAAKVCDRFVLLSGGRVRGEGTLSELSALAGTTGSAAGADLEAVFLALT